MGGRPLHLLSGAVGRWRDPATRDDPQRFLPVPVGDGGLLAEPAGGLGEVLGSGADRSLLELGLFVPTCRPGAPCRFAVESSTRVGKKVGF